MDKQTRNEAAWEYVKWTAILLWFGILWTLAVGFLGISAGIVFCVIGAHLLLTYTKLGDE